MIRSSHPTSFTKHLFSGTALLAALSAVPNAATAQSFWDGYAGNAQHTALSSVASQNLQQILWSTPVDLDPQYSGTDLYIHYGSPSISQADTVVVPVKMQANGNFELEGFNGANGALKWTETTDWIAPPATWYPAYSPAMTPAGKLYYAGAGGTIYSISNIDSASPTAPTQTAFYGNSVYNANKSGFNANVEVCTPITSDAAGDIFFGYRVSGTAPNGMASGIAMISASGATTYISASTATGGLATQIPIGCAPAITSDGKNLYIGMSNGSSGAYLVELNASTLATEHIVKCLDPRNGNQAMALDISSASPMIAPDGTVYYGVFENPYYSSKGWMMHYSANLQTTYTPGLFGWDDTASIVPTSMIPGYSGTSSYLIMTKYNNYIETGGNGLNQVAVLDPNATMVDSRTGVTVMNVVESVLSPTPYSGGGFTEWCINSAVVDPLTDSIIVNNEDGNVYRWDLATDTLSQTLNLAPATGEAYTPTLIGPNGEVYAINDAVLFGIGNTPTPEPGALTLLLGGATAFAITARRRLRRRQSKRTSFA